MDHSVKLLVWTLMLVLCLLAWWGFIRLIGRIF